MVQEKAALTGLGEGEMVKDVERERCPQTNCLLWFHSAASAQAAVRLHD